MRRQWFIAVSLLFASSFLSLNIASSQSQPGQSGQSAMTSGMINSNIVRLGEVKMFGSATSNEIKVPLPQKPKRVLINANYDVLASESVSVGK
jgi:hypothetical protein